jgi:hypothetical protein
MHVGLCVGLFVAFVVLPLLSFLRNGAILRGGAVAVMHGDRKGEEDASVIALQSTKRPSVLKPLEALLPGSDEGSPDLRNAANGGGSSSYSLGEAMSPHSQSSQVFLQASRSAQLRRRKIRLIQQCGGDAAEVAAAEQEGVTASTGSDVASAWDPKQLCADDRIRLVFLFTFALPLFAFWCWELRDARPPYMLDAYCYVRGKDKNNTAPLLRAALEVGPVLVPTAVYFLCFLYYAFFVYLDHRDKDVSLKRHNNSLGNRLVNWFKFRIYRRYVNFLCYLWKRYFSLQLVPAYGPLPLFLFPEGQETLYAKADGAQACGGGNRGDDTPSRHGVTTAAAASTRHNPFFVTVSSSCAGDNSPLDTPLPMFGRSLDAPAFLTTNASHDAPNCSSSGKGRTAKRGEVLDQTPTESSFSSFSCPQATGDGRGEDGDGDDWDEEERELLRTRATPTPAAQQHLSTEAGVGPLPELSGPFSSVDSTKALSTSAPAPPPMRRAHYFFAAHPHGILPWCCCVNLISNVTKRNAKLFVDNREMVMHPPSKDKGSSVSPRDTKREESRDMESATAARPTNPATSAASASLLKANKFTTSNTRAGATTHIVSAKLASPHSPTSEPQLTEGDYGGSFSDPASTTPNATAYAKGRYYVYHPSQRKFVLRLDKDEAVPATPADAAVYQQRLQAAEAKKAAEMQTAGPAAGQGGSSLRQRLKVRIRAVVATFPFYVPLMREIYMFHGYMDASYETCKRVLLYNNSTRREREGRAGKSARADSDSDDDDDGDESTLPEDLNHLMLFPGGASEALLSSSHGPARVLLRRRKGFLRLVLHTQSGLVPVYTFGETDYFDQFSTTTTRYAAPLDDDSTFYSRGVSVQEGEPIADSTTNHVSPRHHCSGCAAGCYRNVIPSCTHDEEDESVTSTSGESRSPTHHPSSPKGATSTLPSGSRALKEEVQRNRRRELEKRLLRDEEDARGRESSFPRSPAQLQPGTGGERGGKPASSMSPTTTTAAAAAPAAAPSAAAHEAVANSNGASHMADFALRTSPQAGRLPRFIQAVQRLFQETFGISLPVVRNLIPHRVTGATVVGRPIYFELPPDLQRMYTDPANYYDREKERAVLLAAQEVYFNELQDLFLKYAPRYLKDPSRRKLEIL